MPQTVGIKVRYETMNRRYTGTLLGIGKTRSRSSKFLTLSMFDRVTTLIDWTILSDIKGGDRRGILQ